MKQRVCWTQNRTNKTPESTNRAMLLALLQDQRTPPKFIAIIMQRNVPHERIAPT